MAKEVPGNGWTKVVVAVVTFAGITYAHGQVMDQRLKTIETQNTAILKEQKESAKALAAFDTRISLLESSGTVNPRAFNEAVQAMKRAADALAARAQSG